LFDELASAVLRRANSSRKLSTPRAIAHRWLAEKNGLNRNDK
jgi:hypothetical protein